MYELTKINTTELTVADADAIKKATGYDVTIPEHKVLFEETRGAVEYLKKHPDYMQLIKVTNIEQILSSNRVLTVTNVKNFAGLDFIQSLLIIAITDICNLFNVNKQLTYEQIQATVDCIIDTAPLCYLTLADIKLALKYLYMGKFGKIYDRIDANVILEALTEYSKERDQIALVYANQRHEQTKQYRSNRVGEVSVGQLLKK